MSYIISSDCEGPAVREDNALDTISHFVPDGVELFVRLNRYDDYLAYGLAHKGIRLMDYNVGSTVKLMLPFLKAYGVTERRYKEFVLGRELKLLDRALLASECLLSRPDRVRVEITTSYRPYAELVGQSLGIAPSNVYSTPFNIDKYSMSTDESERIKGVAKALEQLDVLPPLEIRAKMEIGEGIWRILSEMDSMIWGELAGNCKCANRLLSSTCAMGGKAKVAALYHAIGRHRSRIEHVVYIGDSITDYEILKEVRDCGGLSISFNGSRNAVPASGFVCWSHDPMILALLTEVYLKGGKQAVAEFAETKKVAESVARKLGLDDLLDKVHGEWGVAPYSEEKAELLIAESLKYRSSTLGAAGEFG